MAQGDAPAAIISMLSEPGIALRVKSARKRWASGTLPDSFSNVARSEDRFSGVACIAEYRRPSAACPDSLPPSSMPRSKKAKVGAQATSYECSTGSH